MSLFMGSWGPDIQKATVAYLLPPKGTSYNPHIPASRLVMATSFYMHCPLISSTIFITSNAKWQSSTTTQLVDELEFELAEFQPNDDSESPESCQKLTSYCLWRQLLGR